MFTITEIKSHLTGLGHGGTLNKVRNIDELFERVAARLILKLHILELLCDVELSSTIHDDVFNYTLPYNFGNLVDLIPDYNRQSWDDIFRDTAGQFDRQKAYKNRTLSIESSNGIKFARINWKGNRPAVLNAMDSLTTNGAWTAVGAAANLLLDTINRKSGAGSIKFDVVTSGDGIQNTTMTAVDLTAYNLIGDNFIWVYLDSDFANLVSINPIFGNDLSANYRTGVPITAQQDGTPFRFGWNQIRNPWSTTTPTGTVDPTKIDSYKLTFTTIGAMKNIHVDNIVFSQGKNFEIKFYSKYLYQSASTGLWISIPGDDNDFVMVDNDTLPMFLMECLVDMAHQVEGTESEFDINYATGQLKVLYPAYQALFPSMIKKAIQSYGSSRPIRQGWRGGRFFK